MTEPIQTVQAIYDAFHKGDMAGILARMSPDVVWDGWPDNRAQQAGVPWLQCRKGRDGVAEFFRVLQSMKFHAFQVRQLMGGGQHVTADVVVDVELPSGARYRDEEIHLWSLDSSGEVVRFRHYVDTAKHIEAAARK